MTDFADAAALTPAGEGRWTGSTPPDWTQGRTTFGGLVAAIATDAAVQLVGPERPVRSLDVAFVAPFSGAFTVDAEVLGAGRSATQLAVSVRDGAGGLVSRTHVVAGAGRASRLVRRSAPADPPKPGDPEAQGITLPFLDGVTPTFTQHIAYQWCGEHFPFTGGGPQDMFIRGWCRHRTPAPGLGAVVALLDAWPPASLIMATQPTPASSVRWSCQLTDLAHRVPADAWLWFESDVVHSESGYTTETAALYLDGDLVAWGEQLMTVYDKPS